jgi:sporulation protein YlmC with PRC-barrel domain
MPSPLTEHHGLLLSRARVVTGDGHDLGPVVDLYFDDRTGRPSWAAVRATPPAHPSAAGSRLVLVPLHGATHSRGVLRVLVPAERVATVPGVRSGDHLDGRDERELFDHYGMTSGIDDDAPPRTTTVRTDADAPHGRTTDEKLATA